MLLENSKGGAFAFASASKREHVSGLSFAAVAPGARNLEVKNRSVKS